MERLPTAHAGVVAREQVEGFLGWVVFTEQIQRYLQARRFIGTRQFIALRSLVCLQSLRKDGEVELTDACGVGDGFDFDDLSVCDGDAKNHE